MRTLPFEMDIYRYYVLESTKYIRVQCISHLPEWHFFFFTSFFFFSFISQHSKCPKFRVATLYKSGAWTPKCKDLKEKKREKEKKGLFDKSHLLDLLPALKCRALFCTSNRNRGLSGRVFVYFCCKSKKE